MVGQATIGSSEEDTRRFDVELFIVHPTIDPGEITAALRLEGHVVHPVGAQRRTPAGTLLPGRYKDTRWRHSVRYEVGDQWFAYAVAKLVDSLVPHKAFLHNLKSTGGTATLLVQFLGDGYFGDVIPRDVLARLDELGLDFGIECYSMPQS